MESDGVNPWLYIAEQRKRDRLKKAAKDIERYCEEQDTCEGCIFWREREDEYFDDCMLDGSPEMWD